ncbi:MAG: hypothetical protein H0W74_12815 [Sphingosinicella sp.]|nr:hypothetical protein [Sphingosinicella sp.]
MAANVNMDGGHRNLPWRWVLWSIPLLLLLLPLVAMRFTNEVNWTASDFVFAALLFGSVGIAIELVFRKSGSLAYRLGGTIAVIAAFLTIWVNAAVGMIGPEDNPYNLLFGGVLLIALTGATLARFRPFGMAAAMLAAGVAQGAISAFGFVADTRGAMLSLAFMGLWLLSAALLRSSAQER